MKQNRPGTFKKGKPSNTRGKSGGKKEFKTRHFQQMLRDADARKVRG